VIKGFEQGLVDMCIGEKRKLTIPSHLAYGDEGAGKSLIVLIIIIITIVIIYFFP